MARPRMRNPSKWAMWKRGQREVPGKGGVVHHRDLNYGRTSPSRVRISRARHTAMHNRLRRKRSTGQT